jgi:hypothetical protein
MVALGIGLVWCDYFLFGLVFILKKVIKLIFFIKKRNRFKLTGFCSVRFFRTKTGSSWFGSVFSWFGLVWVRFGFFGFRLIKPKSNRTGQFFQNFNQSCFTIQFFKLFFLNFF